MTTYSNRPTKPGHLKAVFGMSPSAMNIWL
jgi:hypothetical protein